MYVQNPLIIKDVITYIYNYTITLNFITGHIYIEIYIYKQSNENISARVVLHPNGNDSSVKFVHWIIRSLQTQIVFL